MISIRIMDADILVNYSLNIIMLCLLFLFLFRDILIILMVLLIYYIAAT